MLTELVVAKHLRLVRFCRQHLSEAREVADIVPAKRRRNDRNAALRRCRFRDSVVDRDLLETRPHLLEHTPAFVLAFVPLLCDAREARVELWLVLAEEVHEESGTDDEHAGVPAVRARCKIVRGGARVGLLLEARHKARVGCGRERELRAEAHVAEARGGVRGRDADGDEVVAACDLDGLGDSAEERIVARDHMVCGEGTDDGGGIASREDGSGEPDGGHRILRARFSEEVRGLEVGELRADGLPVGRACDDGGAGGGGEGEEAVPGGLDEGAPGEVDVEEELGVVFTRERPETGACAAGGDDDVEAGNFALREREGAERVVAERRGREGHRRRDRQRRYRRRRQER